MLLQLLASVVVYVQGVFQPRVLKPSNRQRCPAWLNAENIAFDGDGRFGVVDSFAEL
jgi:hypothetical protein